MIRKFSIVAFMFAICLLFVACGGGASSSGATKPESKSKGSGPNLALGKEAVASSFEKGNQYNGGKDSVPGFAVDGDSLTRWSSDYWNDKNPNLAWIYVNLGSKTSFQTLNILWEAAMASNIILKILMMRKPGQLLQILKKMVPREMS